MTNSNKPGRTGLSRIVWATRYSWLGIRAAWRGEAAFRQELSLMLIMLPIAFWLGQSASERLLLIIPCFIVIIVELINSAIEAVVDRIGTDIHPLSGQAKDMGSAAVFFALCLVVMAWAMIAWQRFSPLFFA